MTHIEGETCVVYTEFWISDSLMSMDPFSTVIHILGKFQLVLIPIKKVTAAQLCIPQSLFAILSDSYSEVKFPSHSNCECKITSEMDPWLNIWATAMISDRSHSAILALIRNSLFVIIAQKTCTIIVPDNKVHRVHMGPTWDRKDPGGSKVGPMNFAIWDVIQTQGREILTLVANENRSRKDHPGYY